MFEGYGSTYNAVWDAAYQSANADSYYDCRTYQSAHSGTPVVYHVTIVCQ